MRPSLFLRRARLALAAGLGLALLLPAQPERPAPARPDALGDPLPTGAVARLGTLRLRPGKAFIGLTFLPGGKELVSLAHADHNDHSELRFWQPATGKELRRADGPRWPRCLAVSRDGKVLAVGAAIGAVVLLDAASGREMSRFKAGRNFPPFAIAFSPDGKSLVLGGEELCLWSLAGRPRLVRRFPRTGNSINALALSPDGKHLAAESDFTVRLWDTSTAKELRRFEGLTSPESLAFSPDGKHLAAESYESGLGIWDVSTGKRALDLGGPKNGTSAVAFSPDGKWLAAGGGRHSVERDAPGDCSVRLYDRATGKLRHTFPGLRHSVYALAFSPDSKVLAAGAESIRLYDVRTGKRLLDRGGHEGSVEVVAFAPGGRELFTVGRDDVFRTWDARTGKEGRALVLAGRPRSLALAPHGGRVATVSADGPVVVFDAQGKVVRRLPEDRWEVSALALTRDGSRLALAKGEGVVWLYDVSTGKLRRLSGKHGEDVWRLAFSPNGLLLAAGGSQKVSLWEVESGAQVRHFKPKWGVGPLGFSPDGRTLAVASHGWSGIVYGWELATGQERWRLTGEREMIEALAFHPTGLALATGAGPTVEVWGLPDGAQALSLAGHREAVRDLAFSPDGGRLASASEDTTTLIWDVSGLTKRPRARPRGAPADLWKALASADARMGHRAIGTALAAPEAALAVFHKRLRPVAPVDPARLKRCLAGLDSGDFLERERATAALRNLGAQAEAPLRQALAAKPPLEAHRRIERLLELLRRRVPDAEELRAIRAVEALELLAGPEAARILEALARGAPGARVTRDARESLARLAARAKDRKGP
jgi:WD40 repeat protein